MVFNVGCPSIDLVAQTDVGERAAAIAALKETGTGTNLDPGKPFVLMMQHPVTTEYGQSFDQINETLAAVSDVGLQALVFWPNVDAGSEHVAKGIRMFREQGEAAGFHFSRNLPAELFIRLMAHCACMVGNSSASLREGSHLGTPAVTLGTRQQNRECGPNVLRAGHDRAAIATAIRTQIEHGPYERSQLFGDGSAGTKIADILASIDPRIQKSLNYDNEELGALSLPEASAQV
jgi:UDP-N-acetylglucosamine 2-epimerase